ncbi:MAG: hypothetical protein AVDCRST_MAG56-1882 [uncultured Cytophagales bacterium]|uniref:Uncharacterized protein n=1 Tax=uncultured Cytophagales bacterium TaxID=158755 RepID=A0A6J4IGZ6_9SPHI|nr:MAG: hypothetical protein AVDCRST_MAG56-1882 [uncultured Cytophagales bacterium]
MNTYFAVVTRQARALSSRSWLLASHSLFPRVMFAGRPVVRLSPGELHLSANIVFAAARK